MDILELENDMQLKEALTYDDVQLIPRYSEILSRSSADLSCKVTKNYKLRIPIVAAPMDTVCEESMALTLGNMGGLGIIHRFQTKQKQVEIVEFLITQLKRNKEVPIAAAVGTTDDSIDRVSSLLKAGVNIICIDVAHGHHVNVKNTIEHIRRIFGSSYDFDIIAGNIATPEAARDLISWGVDALRVGIGNGSACTTRLATGVGVPQLSALLQISEIANRNDIPIIADGGIRYPGDVAKALAAGASSVMVGSMLAGTDEAPGDSIISGSGPNIKIYKVYRGLASSATKQLNGQTNEYVEGVSALIEAKGLAGDVINRILDGLKSSLSYLGVDNLEDFRNVAEFVRITDAGRQEAQPHILL